MELLHILSVWLTDVRCPHYFVISCNLIHNIFGVQLIASQLMSIDKAWLSTWFVDNYLRKCFILCPDSVSRLLNDVSTNSKLQNAVSVVVNWRLSSALKDTWCALQLSELLILQHVSKFSLTVRSCLCWMSELTKTDRHTHLASLFTAVVFLHVAHKIPKYDFTAALALSALVLMLGCPSLRLVNCYWTGLPVISGTVQMPHLYLYHHLCRTLAYLGNNVRNFNAMCYTYCLLSFISTWWVPRDNRLYKKNKIWRLIAVEGCPR